MPLSNKSRLDIAAAIILLTGFGSAMQIYLNAGDDPDAGMVDEFLNSKKYAHELVVYGGKLTLLADDFSRWFGSLWQGRQLAFTVAAISGAIALGMVIIARSARLQKNRRPRPRD